MNTPPTLNGMLAEAIQQSIATAVNVAVQDYISKLNVSVLLPDTIEQKLESLTQCCEDLVKSSRSHSERLANVESLTRVPGGSLDILIDQRLIEVTTNTNSDTYSTQQRLMEFVQSVVSDNLPVELVTTDAMQAYVDAEVDTLLGGERLVDVIADVIEDRGCTPEEKITRVVRQILRDDVSISIDLC